MTTTPEDARPSPRDVLAANRHDRTHDGGDTFASMTEEWRDAWRTGAQADLDALEAAGFRVVRVPEGAPISSGDELHHVEYGANYEGASVIVVDTVTGDEYEEPPSLFAVRSSVKEQPQ